MLAVTLRRSAEGGSETRLAARIPALLSAPDARTRSISDPPDPVNPSSDERRAWIGPPRVDRRLHRRVDHQPHMLAVDLQPTSQRRSGKQPFDHQDLQDRPHPHGEACAKQPCRHHRCALLRQRPIPPAQGVKPPIFMTVNLSYQRQAGQLGLAKLVGIACHFPSPPRMLSVSRAQASIGIGGRLTVVVPS